MNSPLELLDGRRAPLRTFWEDDLQLPLDYATAYLSSDPSLEQWLGKLNATQRRVLSSIINGAAPEARRKARLRGETQKLFPYFLVHQFARFKSKVATTDYASAELPDETLEQCRTNEEAFDTTSLMFALYHLGWDHLRYVFHLDKIHKSGFARMRLATTARSPKGLSFREFLQTDAVGEILPEYDAERNDGRKSELKQIVLHSGYQLVFIRRAERQSLVLRTDAPLVHGFRPEWIILDFADGAKRVNISSVSVDVPLDVANRIASRYFGKPCEYVNESKATYLQQIRRFLGHLRKDTIKDLVLVEISIENSPLDGAPRLRLASGDSGRIAKAVIQFEKAVGSITEDMRSIESIKVQYMQKRVSLFFEPHESIEDAFVVRYTDHRLNAGQRREFERYMKEEHGLAVLSTEKKFKN